MLEYLFVARYWRSAALAVAFTVPLGLVGCGFHLQGSGALPTAMTRTFIATKRPYSEFSSILTETLRRRGSEIVREADNAAAVLDIGTDDTGQRVLSVSARNIPREYEVYYAITFSLRVGGSTLIDNETIVVTRSYTFDETQVLAKASEEQILRQALAEDLARRVVRRIESLGPSSTVPQS